MNNISNVTTYQQDKIITLDDIKNRSIEDVTKLYKDGYRLKEENISTLQDTCPSGCSPTSEIVFSWLFGFLIGGIAGLAIGIFMTRKPK